MMIPGSSTPFVSASSQIALGSRGGFLSPSPRTRTLGSLFPCASGSRLRRIEFRLRLDVSANRARLDGERRSEARRDPRRAFDDNRLGGGEVDNVVQFFPGQQRTRLAVRTEGWVDHELSRRRVSAGR